LETPVAGIPIISPTIGTPKAIRRLSIPPAGHFAQELHRPGFQQFPHTVWQKNRPHGDHSVVLVPMQQGPRAGRERETDRTGSIPPGRSGARASRFQIAAAAFLLCCVAGAGASETLYVSYSNGDDYVEEFSSSGPTGINTDLGPLPNTRSDTWLPNGVALDSEGNLYVANDGNNTIVRFAPNGNYLGVFATGFDQPVAIAFDRSWNLYVANGANGTISKVSPAGATSVFVSGLSNPQGLAFGPNGNLYVSNDGNNAILEITPQGKMGTFYKDGSYAIVSQLKGLAFDARGNLYVASYQTDTIEKITPAGVASVFAGNGNPSNPTNPKGIFNPIGVTFDASGDLFVGNFHHTQVPGQIYEGHGISYIDEYSPTGVLINAFTSNLSLPGADQNLRDANFIAIRPGPGTARAINGNYKGLGVAGGTNASLVALSMTPEGSFTGKLSLPSKAYSFSGKFSSLGSYSGSARVGAATLDFTLALTSSVPDVTGTITLTTAAGASSYTMEASLLGTFNASTLPSGLEGRYTLVIPPAGGLDPTLPEAPGYGTMTVANTGTIRIAGKLGDGTVFTAGGALDSDGQTWTLFQPLYAGRNPGSISGTMTFESGTGSDCDGTVNWVKPQQTRGSYYPNGFSISADLLAAKYAPPPLTSSTASFALGGGNLPDSAITDDLMISSRSKVTASGDGHVTMTLNPTTGAIAGTFLYPGTNKRTTFGGVFYQKPTPAGFGLFLGSDQSGTVEIDQ
jgi:hypothetical protein